MHLRKLTEYQTQLLESLMSGPKTTRKLHKNPTRQLSITRYRIYSLMRRGLVEQKDHFFHITENGRKILTRYQAKELKYATWTQLSFSFM